MDYLRKNNFDLIRLAAASQVMLLHGITHLEVDAPLLEQFVAYFPGVPAFFLISGFLISASWERNSDLRIFTANRALRIFPALWATVRTQSPHSSERPDGPAWMYCKPNQPSTSNGIVSRRGSSRA